MAKYSFDFKLKVVKFYLKGSGYCSTADHFNIPAFTSVLEWQSLFEQSGLSALEPRKKGRPTKMRLPKKPDNHTEQEKLIDKFQAELAYLRAENDVLKKFQELDAM